MKINFAFLEEICELKIKFSNLEEICEFYICIVLLFIYLFW